MCHLDFYISIVQLSSLLEKISWLTGNSQENVERISLFMCVHTSCQPISIVTILLGYWNWKFLLVQSYGLYLISEDCVFVKEDREISTLQIYFSPALLHTGNVSFSLSRICTLSLSLYLSLLFFGIGSADLVLLFLIFPFSHYLPCSTWTYLIWKTRAFLSGCWKNTPHTPKKHWYHNY